MGEVEIAAYVVIEASVRDEAARTRYAGLAAPILKESGGETIAFGPWRDLVGTSGYRMGMILRFTDAEAAVAWYGSPRYQALLDIRDDAMDCRFRLLAEP